MGTHADRGRLPTTWQDRHPQCAHVFQRGPREGQRCTTRVRHPVEDPDVAQLCAQHARPTCSICLDIVMVGTGVTTPCGHVFHNTCLTRVNGNACPNCRAPLGRAASNHGEHEAPGQYFQIPLEIRVIQPAVEDMAGTGITPTVEITNINTGVMTIPQQRPSAPGRMMFVATLNGGDTDTSDDEGEAPRLRRRDPAADPDPMIHEGFIDDVERVIEAAGGRERLISILLDFF